MNKRPIEQSSSEESSDDSAWSEVDEDDLEDDQQQHQLNDATGTRSHRAQKQAAYRAFDEPWQRLSFLMEFKDRFRVVAEGKFYVIVPGARAGPNYLANKSDLLHENNFSLDANARWTKPIEGNEMELDTLKPLSYKYRGKHDRDLFSFD